MTQETEAFDQSVRLHLFSRTAETGQVPGVVEIGEALGRPRADVEESLRRLAAGRVIVLSPSGSGVWMANPFSAVPTAFRVRARDRTYYGNCIWDALGIPASLGTDARIEAQCGDCGDPMTLEVRSGELTAGDGIMHFGVPAARWWENIGYT